MFYSRGFVLILVPGMLILNKYIINISFFVPFVCLSLFWLWFRILWQSSICIILKWNICCSFSSMGDICCKNRFFWVVIPSLISLIYIKHIFYCSFGLQKFLINWPKQSYLIVVTAAIVDRGFFTIDSELLPSKKFSWDINFGIIDA